MRTHGNNDGGREDKPSTSDFHAADSVRQENVMTTDFTVESALRDLIGDSFNAQRLEAASQEDRQHYQHHLDLPSRSCQRVEQLESWDCGIACLLIILRWIQNKSPTHGGGTAASTSSGKLSDEEGQHYRTLRAAIGTESIWTADLVLQLDFLLRTTTTSTTAGTCAARYLFCSKTFQVEDEYKNIAYYQAAFGQDHPRVTSIFARLLKSEDHLGSSKNNNLLHCAAPQGIPLETVLNAVCHPNCIALVLVDNTVLCRQFKNPAESPSFEPSFVGHYVILCGISRNPEHMTKALEWETTAAAAAAAASENEMCVVLCDPGPDRPALSYITPARFERSWRATGTDEDIIFVGLR